MVIKTTGYIFFLTISSLAAASRQPSSHIDSFRLYGDVKVTIDKPADFKRNKETIITFFRFLMEILLSKQWAKGYRRVMTGILISNTSGHRQSLYANK